MDSWWLYFIECRGGGIYIGIAKNVAARYQKHCDGKGAMYTRLNPPLRLLAQVEYQNHKLAAQAEREMKKLAPWEKWRWARALSGSLCKN